eukprot:scaffold4725_cov140-Skeletonema_dohrnii-CCMP3373.AAC.1
MRDESITIIESSTHNSSHIKGATASKKEGYRSLVVTPSPPKQKSSMGSSPTRSLSPSIFEVSSSKSSSSASGDLDLHLSKDDDRLLDTDDDTASSYEEEEDDNTTDLDYDDISEEDSLLDPAHHFNYYIVDTTTNNITDEKQLFFPPNYHHPTTTNQKNNTTTTNNTQENNPSIPSYFLCPITHQIMIDPVIDLEGNTYERHAIIRWLVLYPNTSPITGNGLRLEELKVDKLVKVAIEKARRDAWVRYILELEVGEDGDGGDEKKKGGAEIANGIKEGKKAKRTSSEPKQKENTMKSDLESYLDRKNATGSTSRSGSKHSATSGSKHSGSKYSGGSSSSSQGKRKKEVVSASVAVAGGSLPPSSSKKQQQQQQKQQNFRPKTPPPSKILLPNEKRNASIKSTKSSKSNSSSGGSVPKEKKPPQAQQRRASDTPRTNPISSITVPTKKTTTTTATSPPLVSSNTSITSAISFGIEKLHNGWTVPLGVHKLICSSPGLLVSTTVHRRSTPVKRTVRDINNNFVKKDLVIAPGSYVEILETQVHGGRVRGRIVWEEEDLECSEGGSSGKKLRRKKKKNKKKKKSLLEKRPKRKSKMFQRGRAKKKMEDDGTHEDEDDDSVSDENMVKYSGWISVQWADEEEEDGNNVAARLGSGSDEDAGPWTEPIPLGVYRISFGAGLPLRETPERDSAVLDKLERGRCVEVVETTVKGDRVRARCLVPPLSQEGDDQPGKKPARFQSGWISLLNALTGASGASPVPLGAYVAVAEGGCVITEGGRLDSKEKGTLNPGSCIEVVATRIEEGTVRGLIAAGGHVTLFVLNGASTNRLAAMGGTKNPDGGRMFAMPVPLGTYQVVQNGLSVTTGLSMNSPVSMKLKVNACAEIAETRVEGGRVRGRLTAVGYGGVAKEVSGWMSLFEPTQRWAKIVCFKGGRPISPHPQQEQAQAQAQAQA